MRAEAMKTARAKSMEPAQRDARQQIYDSAWAEQFKESFPEIYETRVAEGKPLSVKMLSVEQIAIWSEEYVAKQKQEQLYREEYGELRADIRGTTKIRKDEYITTDLLLTHGAEDIGMRMSRKAELEEMLGVGVDR